MDLDLFPFLALAEEIEVSMNVDHVTLYPGGATITSIRAVSVQEGENTLVIKNFPAYADLSTLRVTGDFSETVLIQSLNPIREKRDQTNPIIDSLEAGLADLRKKRAALEDTLKAAKFQLQFVENFANIAPKVFGKLLTEGKNR